MKPSVAHLADLARRNGGAVSLRQKEEPKVEPESKPEPPVEPSHDKELADAIRMLPTMMPPPTVVEVPSAIDTQALARAISEAMRSVVAKPTGWRFTVKRDVDGLIETIEATPRK